MYGQWVTVNLGEDIECKVWVACVPNTPKDVLQREALGILSNRLPEKKTGIWALGDALQKISDYEYSQRYGTRYEAEKELNRLLEQESK
jgi:hypothetical protein